MFIRTSILRGRLAPLALAVALALAPAPARAAGPVATTTAASHDRPHVTVGDAILRASGDEEPGEGPRAGAGTRAGAKTPPQRRTRRRRARRARPAAAAPVMLRYTAPRSRDALSGDLGAMIGRSTRSGRWGVMVVSLTRGDTIYALNADEHFLPASTFKLFTSALALERFGPEYQLSTDVLRDGTVGPDGTLNGNLILRGDGDPSLSNRFLRGSPNMPMDVLARFVAGAGIKRVTGDIIGDASAFDDERIPQGWLSRYLGAGYAARVSGLSLNENLVAIVAYPTQSGTAANVVFEPGTTTMTLVNKVRTVGGSGGRVAVVKRADGVVEARGTIGVRSAPRGYQLVVDDPALFTTGAFRAALERNGIQVGGQTRLAAAPATAQKVTSLPSPTLARMLAAMNRESINHYAELLFRDAARGPQRSTQGSAGSGDALLDHFVVDKLGLDSSAVHAADGSGLSTLDQITPRAMVSLLGYADRAPWGSAFHASLPVAGESELLRHRMRFTPAQGNLHAKTGTTNEVIGLAGYVTAEDGEVLAFSFVYNGHDRWNAKSAMDTMGATLAGFVRE